VEFKDNYVPTYLKENFLPIQIGKIFLDYRVKEYEEFHKACDITLMEYPLELKQKSEQKCREMYGGFTPWEILNDLLNAYGTFEYNFTYPEKFITGVYSHQSESTFIPKLINAEKNISINYDQLSSGEQILFSLALCLFKGKSDKIFPKLLLLDEIDASLHPSMIENLLRVIQEVLLKKGTKVILATHSPTTVALVPEESVFVVNREGENRIEHHDRKSAIEILTQGYVTLDKGLRIFDQISKREISIITEGNNTKYIEKAIELFAKDKKDKIDVISGAEGSSGDTQLKTLFNFFTKVEHEKKVIFVWDWDYSTNSLEKDNNTIPYNLPKNDSNSIAPKGIENMFDERFFDDFITIKRTSKGQETKMFDGTRKVDFMTHMISIGNTENFGNFKSFIWFIENVM
jgi:ABC-type multidrug transport system ATPase subunit